MNAILNAFHDQYSTRMPVSEAAHKLQELIKENPIGIRHLGGTKQTILQLARNISPNKNIQPMSINDLPDYIVPKDTSLKTLYGKT